MTKRQNWEPNKMPSVQNDYDGDGKVDIAGWRSSDGRWQIKKSTTGLTRTEFWGIFLFRHITEGSRNF